MNIFHLYDDDIYRFGLGRQRVSCMDIISTYKHVNLWRSGPGWDNWDDSKSLYYNITNICGIIPDVVVSFIAKNGPQCIINEFGSLPMLTVITYDELRKELQPLVNKIHPDIVAHTYIQEARPDLLPNTKWYHISHSPASTIFQNLVPFNDRKIDISLYGFLNANVYPIRTKMMNALCTLSKKYNCYYHPHCGQKLPNAYTNQHLVDLNNTLNQSKIVCVCSSIFKYKLHKFVEIPACGAVMVGDLPILPNDDNLSDCMIVIDDDINTTQIVDILKESINNYNLLIQKHKNTIEYSLKYSVEAYALRLYQIIEDNL